MRKYKYSYSIYKNDYPVYICDTTDQLAAYLSLDRESIRRGALYFRKLNKDKCKVYSYYDEVEKVYDCSQLYYATKRYEIYRFWSYE